MTRTMPRRAALLSSLAGLSLVALTACGGSGGDPLQGSTPTSGGASGGEESGGAVVVGSANFPESQLLAEMYAAALRRSGVEVTTRLNIGSRETYLKGLEDGSIDVIPEYTGNLALHYDKELAARTAKEVEEALPRVLPDTLEVLEAAPAEDKDAVVVTRATADEKGLATLSDLQGKAGEMVLGGPPEWKTRDSGIPGLKKVYGLEFKSFRELQAGGALTVQALKNGQVDAANIFSTDPAIPANDLVALKDDKGLFLPQNVVPLARKGAVTGKGAEAVDELSASLTTEGLTAELAKVVNDRRKPAEVAQAYVDAL